MCTPSSVLLHIRRVFAVFAVSFVGIVRGGFAVWCLTAVWSRSVHRPRQDRAHTEAGRILQERHAHAPGCGAKAAPSSSRPRNRHRRVVNAVSLSVRLCSHEPASAFGSAAYLRAAPREGIKAGAYIIRHGPRRIIAEVLASKHASRAPGKLREGLTHLEGWGGGEADAEADAHTDRP